MYNINKPLIFDIGANQGNFSNKYIKKCKIIAVEANPILSNKIKERFSNNDIEIEQCAISNKNSEIDFYICPDDQMSSCNKNWLTTLRYKNAGIKEIIKIKSITIDHLIQKYGNPFHMKIDVEGYEFEAVSGLSQKSGSIQFEYIKENFKDLTAPTILKLNELGYSKFKIKEADGDFDPFIEEGNFLTTEEILKKGENLAELSGMILAL
jgi:FkbM family methyltransferase